MANPCPAISLLADVLDKHSDDFGVLLKPYHETEYFALFSELPPLPSIEAIGLALPEYDLLEANWLPLKPFIQVPVKRMWNELHNFEFNWFENPGSRAAAFQQLEDGAWCPILTDGGPYSTASKR
eukprot:RCo009339